ncbi:MAG: glutamyl-tRNA synthetase [Betaproteobacteria bacterium]|jgi:glutamyl-tRNA synthetase|nr:glutamyl-tRNA synthetase [Betaproteobacteria bacterium]
MAGIRTRFAPSPTGFLHIGGARTALYSWAYARRHKGTFVLRVEDTDLERSTKESVQAILDGMRWLGLDWDEGPFFQMQRLARYKEVAEQLIAAGHAYRDYMPKEELDKLREQQAARGEKPRYDRAIGQNYRGSGPAPVRFKTPQEGQVGWNDLVKGPIEFPNAELDDLVLLRADGVPTYNFGVVVDDIDMDITHVIRGDDHVNNTPRQIHIYEALKMPLPRFGHVPMILGADGERLSKRHGATSVMEYGALGFLPEALDNYLARLGWSHGDAEIFTLEQFKQWFDLEHVHSSPARFDLEKLKWLNQQYLKGADSARLVALVQPLLPKDIAGPPLARVVELVKDRGHTVRQLAEEAMLFYAKDVDYAGGPLAREVMNALENLKDKLEQIAWERGAISSAIKETITAAGLKMPQLAMPLRQVVTGRTQTPSIDAVLELLGRETVLRRLTSGLEGQ